MCYGGDLSVLLTLTRATPVSPRPAFGVLPSVRRSSSPGQRGGGDEHWGGIGRLTMILVGFIDVDYERSSRLVDK